MRSGVAFRVLLGLAILAVTLLIIIGGKSMSMRYNDTEARIGLPPADARLSGTFETATFALG